MARLRSERLRASAVESPSSSSRSTTNRASLRDATFAWVEVPLGQGGLAWLAAWTALCLDDDPLRRPALWVDTHRTFTPSDLLDLRARLVVVRPEDPHEAHVAAELALRSGAFGLVALEMHPALHPIALGRLARLASARRGDGKSKLVLWGEPPAFIAPPRGIPRSTLADAIAALFEAASDRDLASLNRGVTADAPAQSPTIGRDAHAAYERLSDVRSLDAAVLARAPDRVRAMDRAADRRAPAAAPVVRRPDVDGAARARADASEATQPLDDLFAAFPRRPDFD
jgi:hypothetical protein